MTAPEQRWYGPNPAGDATVARRVTARLVDVVLALIVAGAAALALTFLASGAISELVEGHSNVVDTTDHSATWYVLPGALAAATAYEIIPVARHGRTPGKHLAGIAVVDAASGDLPGWGSATRRAVIPAAVVVVPFVGWMLLAGAVAASFCLLFVPPHQTISDRAASTRVVHARTTRT